MTAELIRKNTATDSTLAIGMSVCIARLATCDYTADILTINERKEIMYLVPPSSLWLCGELRGCSKTTQTRSDIAFAEGHQVSHA